MYSDIFVFILDVVSDVPYANEDFTACLNHNRSFPVSIWKVVCGFLPLLFPVSFALLMLVSFLLKYVHVKQNLVESKYFSLTIQVSECMRRILGINSVSFVTVSFSFSKTVLFLLITFNGYDLKLILLNKSLYSNDT